MTLLAILLSIPTAILFALAAWLLTEVVAGVTAPPRTTAGTRQGRVAVIVPAHNEASVIAPTLASLSAQLRTDDTLLLVADNCSDATAAIARAAGATVTERQHATDRGKGFALQHGLDLLKTDPPSTVLIVDADCRAAPGLIDRLASAAEATGRPVQSLNLMRAPAGAGPKQRVAEFAWAFMNRTRISGLSRLFGVCRMLGTGMGFPWAVARGLDLATAEIVEDLALAAKLSDAGHPPLFVPDALVTSDFPTDEAAATTQRARWEIGSMTLARQVALPMFFRSLGRRRFRAAALAIDIAVPPLVLFATILITAFFVAAVIAVAGITLPFWFALAACLCFGASVLAGWAAHGREALPVASLGALGGYAASKTRVYGRTGRSSTRQWTRTERD